MRWSARRTIIGSAVLLTGMIGLYQNASDAADPVPEKEFKSLVDQDAKQINTLLRDGKPAKKTADRGIKSSAMMIAYYAQSRMNGKNDGDARLATLRDTALEVAKTGGKKKYMDAVAPAKMLAVDIAPAAKPNLNAMTVLQMVNATGMDMEELMYQFKKTTVGGLGIEAEIKDISAKKTTIAPDKASTMAARILAVANFSDVIEPTKGFTPKTPKKDWDESNNAMREAAKEVLAAANAKDAKKMQAAYFKLDGACTSCHDKFK